MKRRKSPSPEQPTRMRSTTQVLLSYLALSAIPTNAAIQAEPYRTPPLANLAVLPPFPPNHPPAVVTPSLHDFTLRHIFHHGTYQYPDLHRRLDVFPDSAIDSVEGSSEQLSRRNHYIATSRPLEVERLVDRSSAAIESHLKTARSTGEPATLAASAWTVDELPGPNISDKNTVLTLARVAADAYVKTPGEGEWEEVGGKFNRSTDFGWEQDGLRGYIFADETNSTIIMGLKGTSSAVFDGSETTTNDKENDNLFFSCCCGQGGQFLWRRVCECQTETYTCNQTCLVKELKAENRYYRASIDLFTNVTELYPDSNIWLTGHSLGGAISAMLGLTFGVPVVTFEAPGDDLPVKRLGLPSPPNADPHRPHMRSRTGAYHFGHTADPVFMGSCNGAAATCTFAGYAMESQCHTGNVCRYDTVGDFGWRVGIGNHKIHVVIDSVIKAYDSLPICETDDECVDCFNWKYFESNGSDTTTSTSARTTTTKTRTTTCETPGWWGCLDKTTTTTTTSSTTTTTTTTSTSTCKTPGWFGCKDPTVTATSITSTSATPSQRMTTSPSPTSLLATSGTTCHSPGWLGHCKDPTSTVTTPATTTSTKTPRQTCETPGIFWGCRDRKTPEAAQHPITTSAAPEDPDAWKQEI